MIEKYPFLLPRNRWTGLVSDNYDYSYTELDAMPEGWRKAFGLQMCDELKHALGDYVCEYRISQIKEKWGRLCWYDFGGTQETFDIITKFSLLSEKTCIMCGKPAKYRTIGWVSPYCENCIGDEEYVEITKKR